VKMTTHLHLELSLRIRGTIPPLPYVLTWYLVKPSDNFTLPVPSPTARAVYHNFIDKTLLSVNTVQRRTESVSATLNVHLMGDLHTFTFHYSFVESIDLTETAQLKG
jgi:hypothetical protein